MMPKFRISNIHMATESIIINRNKTFKAGAIVLDSKSTFSANWRLWPLLAGRGKFQIIEQERALESEDGMGLLWYTRGCKGCTMTLFSK